MFCVTEAEATMIRTALEQGGELAAAVELRRLFRGIGSNEVAREFMRALSRGGGRLSTAIDRYRKKAEWDGSAGSSRKLDDLPCLP